MGNCTECFMEIQMSETDPQINQIAVGIFN